MIKIAVDAMGGDYAPGDIIKGCVNATKTCEAKLILVGKEEVIAEDKEFWLRQTKRLLQKSGRKEITAFKMVSAS